MLAKDEISAEQQQRLREKILRYCKRLAKKEPAYAKQLETHVDQIVAWYITNRRDMNPADLREILQKTS